MAIATPFNLRLKTLLRGYALYILAFIFCYLVLYFFGVFKFLPTNEGLLKWDACWYDSIKNKGYYYHWYEPSNSAFFPLFAYMWKFLFLSNAGISIFNFALLLFSLGLLYFNFEINIKYIFIYLSLPSSIFFFLPFSEAIFFLFGSIMLIGLHKNNLKLILIGLFLTSLTRATAMFFVPAIIMMEFIGAEKLFDKRMIKNILLYSSVAVIGLLLVVLFQYSQTGEWFAFAKQQVKYWHHHFSFPGFPLTTLGNNRIVWLDLIAFLFCLIAFLMVLIYGLRKLFTSEKDATNKKAFWFSASYLFMAIVYALFFNPKFLNAQTSIEGANRYVFASVFFFIFLTGALKYFKLSFLNFIYFALAATLTFILFGWGGDSLSILGKSEIGECRNTIFFVSIFLYCSLYYFSGSKKYGVIFSYLLISVNVLLSLLIFYDFLDCKFIA